MLTLHHLEYSQSFRILWLLEELGAAYELKLYERDKRTMLAPADYKRLSPLGSAPVITDGELVLAESSAIIEHILDQHTDSPLRPAPGAPNRTRHLFWFHAAQGSLMPLMLITAAFAIMRKRAPFFVSPVLAPALKRAEQGFVTPRMDALLAQAERDLADAPWFGGDDLTAADIVLSYPMESAQARGFITASHPNCAAWLERMRARPSFQTAMAKDGRDSMVLRI